MDADMIIPEDARQRYLERRKTDIQTLKDSLSRSSFEEFKRIGHQLKGNAISFGYPDLEKIAIQLEAAGDSQNVTAATDLVTAFETWLAINLKG